MKIPSLKYLKDEAVSSAVRFPLTLLSALIGVSVAVYLVEFDHDIDNQLPFVNLLLVSALGLVLFFSINIYKDKKQKFNPPSWLLSLIGLILLLLIYFTLPGSEETNNISQPYIRYTIYNVVAHLLVSFAPFISKGEINGFWQYNKMLFLRFCLSILYSGFVYIGLVLALVSLNLLFDADIDGERFFQLFIIVFGLFNTWFFISGVDRELDSLEEKTDYPKGLKTFAQYVLLPLLILYLIILYAYVAKIVGLWDWPKGIVSYLIVCVAVLGILTFLLIYPFGEKEKEHWISKFSKFFYYTLLPLTAVLFIAIVIRIDDYGLTVNRYLIVELGLWLLFVSLYFIVGAKNIKVIPMSLAGMILITSIGPWGMFGVSESSQVGRLETILSANGLLTDAQIINEPVLELGDNDYYVLQDSNKNELLLTDSLKNEVYSILDYLDDHHGFDKLNHWFVQNPDSVMKVLVDSSSYYWSQAKIRMELMGLEYRYRYNGLNDDSYSQNYQAQDAYSGIMMVTGYDYILDVNFYDYKQEFNIENQLFRFSKVTESRFELVLDTDTATFDFADIMKQLGMESGDGSPIIVDNRELILLGSNDSMKAEIRLDNLTIETSKEMTTTDFSGKIFIKMPN
ncbi:MAG: DUF4153 domain-containing protein [Cytophagales bacterium]|nr:DUF4153 domain-containing protein [Cytophagales bacterium]